MVPATYIDKTTFNYSRNAVNQLTTQLGRFGPWTFISYKCMKQYMSTELSKYRLKEEAKVIGEGS